MDNNTTLTFEEKLNYLLRRHYNLFHCDVILEALYNESPDDYYFIVEEIDFPRDSWCEICHTLSSFKVEYFNTDGFIYDVLFDSMSAEMFN